MSTRRQNIGGRGIFGHRKHDILDALVDAVPMTAAEVCREKGTDRSDTRGILGVLVSMGFVETMLAKPKPGRTREVRMYLITLAGSAKLIEERDIGHVPGVPANRVREIMKRRVACRS